MKVYSTLVAVEQLLERGIVQRGDTLIDSSSGLYALSLALACHKYGMRCHIIASRAMDKGLMTQIQILGATVEQVQTAATLKLDQSLRVERIQGLLARDARLHWMQQYHDEIHYAGYEPIAALIKGATGFGPLIVVGAVGSGASTGGLATFLRRDGAEVDVVGVQPFGSVTFGSEHVDDPGIIIAGIGSAIPFRNVRHELYDRVHWVSFEYGRAGSIALLRRHAIFAGLSSGCCYLVASREARMQPARKVVFIAADTGHRYVESVFAGNEDAQDIEPLSPTAVTALADLALPWCVMDWTRSTYPGAHAAGRSEVTGC